MIAEAFFAALVAIECVRRTAAAAGHCTSLDYEDVDTAAECAGATAGALVGTVVAVVLNDLIGAALTSVLILLLILEQMFRLDRLDGYR